MEAGMGQGVTTKVGIIGTAGRGADAARLHKDLFDAMVYQAIHLIEEEFKLEWERVHLVSGGAAWADHVAVTLWNMGKCLEKRQPSKLTVYMPCPWDFKQQRYHDDGRVDWRSNPGGTSNYYHRLFSQKLQCNTLAGIHQAASSGAVLDSSHKGLFQRNTAVAANVDCLIAFTFLPFSDGGTKHTWDSCPSSVRKVHVPLDTLLTDRT
ncbi:DprA-like DNA processing chain A [Balamuthia mandrillaris]